jgi:hypothetical protein
MVAYEKRKAILEGTDLTRRKICDADDRAGFRPPLRQSPGRQRLDIGSNALPPGGGGQSLYRTVIFAYRTPIVV